MLGNSKELKTHLKAWEPSPTGGLPAIFSLVKSIFVSKEQTSNIINEAAASEQGNMKDWEFLTALPDKVSKEPLLEQLAQDAITEAYRYFGRFMQRRLPRFYSRVYDIKQKAMYRQS
jgi:hypothetical protein